MSTTLQSRPARHRRPAVSPWNLGLQTEFDEFNEGSRMFGLRSGRMVEIRFPVGDYESATWILAPAPRFGMVLGSGPAPAVIAAALGDIPVVAPIWSGLLIRGSELGLVALRSAPSSMPEGFLHDLWLLERIATVLALLPLPAGNLAAEPIPGGVTRPESLRRAG